MRFIAWVSISAAVCWGLAWFFEPRPVALHGQETRGWTAFLRPTPRQTDGVVSWKALGEVSTVRQNDRLVPRFSNAVSALDGTEVKLHGFMTPLTTGERHERFLLSALPPTCAFCLPGGADAVVEVRARVPVQHAQTFIVLSGRFAVLRDDPAGLYYRLSDAVLVP